MTIKMHFWEHLLNVSCCIFISTLFFGAVVLAKADQLEELAVKPPPLTAYYRTGVTPDGWVWADEKWSGDNAPYAEIRSRIDSQMCGGAGKVQALLNFQAVAASRPHDPEAQFGYAYAAWKIHESVNNLAKILDVLEDSLDRLESVPSPHTYDFVRLRFLIQSALMPKPEMLSVGKRLLDKDPNDLEVKYRFASLLMTVPDGAREKALALPVIDQLIKAEPADPNPYYLRGLVYIDSCNKNNNTYTKPDVDAAETAFNKYIELAPANDYWKPGVQQVIDGLERIKANGYKLPDIPQHDSDK